MTTKGSADGLPFVNYWRGTDEVVFSVEVPHGKGTRRVEFRMPADHVATLGLAFHGRARGDERGHAAWHLNRGDRPPFDCPDCHRERGLPG